MHGIIIAHPSRSFRRISLVMKGQKTKQQHLKFTRKVAAEVAAIQAADQRADAARKAAERLPPRTIVTFDPGQRSDISDSDEYELEQNFARGKNPFCPTAPRSPFNAYEWKQNQPAQWAEMPFIRDTQTGLICLVCAGVPQNHQTKWSLGTACPSQLRGQAEQHCLSGKHLKDLEAAKSIPAVSLAHCAMGETYF